MFDPVWKLALGLCTGIVFGFLLQKGRVAKYEVIVGQFLGRDFTVVKIMGTAVVVGSIGIYALLPTETISLHIKPLLWAGILIGGALFGIGMAVLGYCPGTGVAACGEGRKDAFIGLLGMFVGAGIFVAFYPTMSKLMSALGDAGKVTLPQVTDTSPWIWIVTLTVIAIAAVIFTRKKSMNAKQSIPTLLFITVVAMHSSDVSAQFGGLFSGGPKIESIETDALAKMLRDQREAEAKAKAASAETPVADFVVVDVRSDAEVNVSVIPGAITKAQYEKNRHQYAGRLVIPYCTVGGRSGAYAKQLAKDGVKVQNYTGSILKWVDAGLPLVTLKGEPTNRVHTYSDRYRIPAKYERVTK